VAWVGPGLFRFSVARFLAALVLLFIASPFIEAMTNGAVVESVLATVVVCMGVLAVGGRRQILVLAVVLVLPAVVANWAQHIWHERFPVEAVLAARLVFLAFVVARLLVFILRAPKVNSEVLCAGVSVYLLIGLVWSLGYRLLATDAFAFSVPPSSPHEMTKFNAFYFSFMTLTTVGYGDITPVSPIARMLAAPSSSGCSSPASSRFTPPRGPPNRRDKSDRAAARRGETHRFINRSKPSERSNHHSL
jgi:hypothetical protein